MREEFKEFPKISRFYEQDVCITEKIDGTNGLIYVSEDLSVIRAGSRSRWITIEDDNYGFARWVSENSEQLINLGSGYHYGEWWGHGVQRKYGMSKKVFSLFNVNKWTDDSVRPDCCDVVPVLYNGLITPGVVETYSHKLGVSVAAQKYGVDFGNPEGVMMYFVNSGTYFKCPDKKGRKS